MSTIVEATLSADQFALYETLRKRPSTEFETVRVVIDGTDRVMPFLWATAETLDGLPAVIADDPSTRNVDVLTALDEEYLFRMEWVERIRMICHVIVEENGTILDAYGKNDAWTFRILFPEHDSVSSTHDFCEAYDLDIEFERIYDLSGSFRRGRYGLTESQYETILSAYDRGYYAVPRNITLADLAGDLDVSHQALSERLRRGHGTLVERALRPELIAPVES